MSDQRIVVLGVAGGSPFAGVAWQTMHYLEGLRRLGHDVHYVEDTGAWPYDPDRDAVVDQPSYAIAFIARMMERCSLPGRFAYRGVTPAHHLAGMAEEALAALYRDADVLINLTGATVLREEHMVVPRRIFLETDPVVSQIEVAQGNTVLIELLAAHTEHRSFGENLGAPDCPLPLERFAYRPTRQPVVLDWWEQADDAAGAAFTTVANWQQTGKDVTWRGERYGWSKHTEFLRFLDLPARTAQPLELALASLPEPDRSLLSAHGWRVADAVALSRDADTYRNYLRASRGEFTVAKDQNIRLRSGWFSDRSACYLAAGRPVVTQDTGFGASLPTSDGGLYSFRTMEDIVAALDSIATDIAGNRRRAREIAHDFFDSTIVLSDLLG